MPAFDLNSLKRGDPASWDKAFPSFFGPAARVARSVLGPHLADEAEDVAIEAVGALVEKVKQASSLEELNRLVVGIAHNKAVSHVRAYVAEKRGGGRTESLEARQAMSGEFAESPAETSPLAAIEAAELAERMGRVLESLKPPQGEMLADRFLRGLTHDEIGRKYGVGVKSVGSLLARALRALRGAWEGRQNEM